MDCGTPWFDRIAFDGGVLFAQIAGRAGERAARANEITKCIDCAARLLPDLGAGGCFVGIWIATPLKLVSPKRATLLRHLTGDPVNFGKIRTRYLTRFAARQLIHQHDFSAESRHHSGSFRRIAFRHDRNKRIALDAADDGQTGAHIAAGQFHNALAWLQGAIPLRRLDHPQRGPVLFGKPRVEMVQLGQNAAVHTVMPGEAVKPHQWGIANGVND